MRQPRVLLSIPPRPALTSSPAWSVGVDHRVGWSRTGIQMAVGQVEWPGTTSPFGDQTSEKVLAEWWKDETLSL